MSTIFKSKTKTCLSGVCVRACANVPHTVESVMSVSHEKNGDARKKKVETALEVKYDEQEQTSCIL